MGKLGNIVFATKMFLNLFGNIFAYWEAKFCSCNNVSRGGPTANKVSATMFPSLPRDLVLIVRENTIQLIIYVQVGLYKSMGPILSQAY